GYHQSAVGHLSPFIHECRTYYLNSRITFQSAKLARVDQFSVGVDTDIPDSGMSLQNEHLEY
ncbi:hypothetical protein Q7I19_20285, partial [Aeromonas veronii]|uniref:hypothetical protein n=1 Tax=Aeromonas veronii TaxID=654 RepID=UPI003005EA97